MSSLAPALCLGIAALVCAHPISGQAQETGVVLGGDRVEISAAELVLGAEGWQASGQVKLGRADEGWSLDADRAVLQGDILELEGVRMTRGQERWEMASLWLNLTSGALEGRALKLEAPTSPVGWVSLRAATFEQRDGVLSMQRARWRTSATKGKGPWQSAQEVQTRALWALGPADGVLKADMRLEPTGIGLRLGGVPVGWTPGVETPLDGRRLGLLPPTLGWLDGLGLFGHLRLFAPLGSSADLSLGAMGASEGMVGGSLRLRHTQRAALAPMQGSLEVQGRLDEPGVMVGGAGALDPVVLPALRYSGTLLTDRQTGTALRAPLALRLGAVGRSAVVLGPDSGASGLDLEVALWQPLSGSGPLWRDRTTSAAIISGNYHLRGALGDWLRTDLEMGALRVAPLSASGAQALDPQRSVGHRLILGTGAVAPVTLGQVARLTLQGRLKLDADIFDVPLDQDNPSDHLVTPRLGTRQRAVTLAGGVLESTLVGQPAQGWRHSITATVGAWSLPTRRAYGDVEVFGPTIGINELLASSVFFAGLSQRLGRGGVGALHLDLGALYLKDVQGFVSNDNDVVHVGAMALWKARTWSAQAWADVDLGAGGLSQGRAVLRWGEPGQRSGRLGVTHVGAGPRLTALPWLAPSASSMVGVRAAALTDAITGLDAGGSVALWPGSAWRLRASALVPLSGQGLSVGDGEWLGALVLGEDVGRLTLELQVARRAATGGWDVLLMGRAGSF